MLREMEVFGATILLFRVRLGADMHSPGRVRVPAARNSSPSPGRRALRALSTRATKNDCGVQTDGICVILPTPAPVVPGGVAHPAQATKPQVPAEAPDVVVEDLGPVGQALLEMLRIDQDLIRSRTSQHRERDVSSAEAQIILRELVAHGWADSTRNKRRALFKRLVTWLRKEQLPLTGGSCTQFVAAMHRTPNGALSAAADLSGTLHRLGICNSETTALISLLKAGGAGIPLTQAYPIERDMLHRWVRRQMDTAPELALAALLAWKSMSRWHEAHLLSGDNFLTMSPGRIIIDWWRLPKSSRGRPFRPSRFCVIEGPLTRTIYSLYMIVSAARARDGRPMGILTEVTATELSQIFLEDADARLRECSGHSFKQGALAHIEELEARGTSVDPILVSRCMKHANPKDPITTMRVRYGGLFKGLQTGRRHRRALRNKAILLRTQVITRLLT